MLAQVWAGLAQSAQIDDALDPGVSSGACECQSQLMIVLGVVGSRRHHGMDEVIRCLTSFQLAGQRRFVGQICQSDLNVWVSSPRAILQFGWRPHQTPDCIAVLEQTRGKTAQCTQLPRLSLRGQIQTQISYAAEGLNAEPFNLDLSLIAHPAMSRIPSVSSCCFENTHVQSQSEIYTSDEAEASKAGSRGKTG